MAVVSYSTHVVAILSSTSFKSPRVVVGVEETILADDMPNKFATSWSSDGRFIVFDSADATSSQKGDLWLLPMTGDRTPISAHADAIQRAEWPILTRTVSG
jgi:Tol biopolymer transport system component